jgi:predicted MFS family arabinose efflux permease
VVYADRALHAGASGFGLLLAAWGAGTVLSSIALARAEGTAALVLIPLGALGVGAGFVVMALAPGLAIAMLGCLLGGAGNGVYYVSVVQALQERIEEDFQARVMSLLESTTAGAYGIGFLLGGVLTAAASSRLAIGVAGAGVIVAAGAIVALMRGDRRTAAPRPVAAESAA